MCCSDLEHILGRDLSGHRRRALQHSAGVHETADAFASARFVPVLAAAGNDLPRLWDIVRRAMARAGVADEVSQAVAAMTPQSVGWMLTQMMDTATGRLLPPPETLVVQLSPGPTQLASSVRPLVDSGEARLVNLLLLVEQDAITIQATTETGPLDEVIPAGGAIALRLRAAELQRVLLDGAPAGLDTFVPDVSAGTLHLTSSATQRWSVVDTQGRGWFPTDALEKHDSRDRPWFAAADVQLTLPAGSYEVSAARGVGWTTAHSQAQVDVGTETVVTLAASRRFETRSRGWVSADLHVHMNYGGAHVVSPDQAAAIQDAEDLDLANLVAANHTGSHIYDREYLETTVGQDLTHHDGRTAAFGVEYRNDLLGHFETVGATSLVDLYQRGHTTSEFPFDSPSNAEAARRYRDASASVAYAHPVFPGSDDVLDRVFDPAGFEPAARESVADALLGLVDSLDVVSNADPHGSALLYRKLLSVGCRLAATAGTDVVLSSYKFATLSNPPGWARMYAQTAGDASTRAVAEAIRAGRTIATNGPWLELGIADAGIGDTVWVEDGSALPIRISWHSLTPAQIHVHVNQYTESFSVAPGADARVWTIDPPRAGPVTLELVGTEHDEVLHGVAYAHTSPVYVEIPGQSWVDENAIDWCQRWLDRLLGRIESHGVFETPSQKQDLVALVGQASHVLRARASGA